MVVQTLPLREAAIAFGLPMKYDAFISYSHTEAEQRLARALERCLQQFAKPWYKPRARDIFRDEANLNLSPHLWGSIEAALNQSRFFLCMASPASAQSKWVGREIEHWRNNRERDRMVLLLTDGDLVWDESSRDFDAARSTAISSSLFGAFEDEPLYLDLRWTRNDEDLSLTNPRFKQAVVQIAAALEETSVESMFGEEFEQHRRTTRIRNGVITALSVLLVLAIAAAVVAFDQREEARAQARDATLRLLSLEADNSWKDTKNGREGPAVAKFLYQNLPDHPLAQAVIFKVLHSPYSGAGRSGPIYEGVGVTSAGFSHTGDAVVLGLVSGEIRVLGLNGDELARIPSPTGAALRSTQATADGGVLAIYDDGGAVLWTRAGERILAPPDASPMDAAVARDGSSLVIWSEGFVVLHDAFGEPVASLEFADGGTVQSAALSRDGDRLGLLVLDTAQGCRLNLYSRAAELVDSFALVNEDCERTLQFSPRSDEILLHGRSDEQPRLIDFAGNQIGSFRMQQEDWVPWFDQARFGADGRVLMISNGQNGKGLIWEGDGSHVADLWHVNVVNDIDGNESGKVVTGSDDDTLKIWSPTGVEIFSIQLLEHVGESGVQQIAFSPDGNNVLVVHGTPPWAEVSSSSVEVISIDLSQVMDLREAGSQLSKELLETLAP